MPPHLKKSKNQVQLEKITCEEVVTQLERELELNSLEAPDEIQMNTVTDKPQIEGKSDIDGNINSYTNDSNPNNNKNYTKSRTVYPPSETSGKTSHPTDRLYVGANATSRPLPWKSKLGGHIGPQKQDAQYLITECA